MKRDQLDSALEKIKEEKIPDSPGNLEHNVMRRIRQREAELIEEGWNWVNGLLVNRSFLMATFSLTIMVSMLITGFATKTLSGQLEPVQASLHFESLVKAPIVQLIP